MLNKHPDCYMKPTMQFFVAQGRQAYSEYTYLIIFRGRAVGAAEVAVLPRPSCLRDSMALLLHWKTPEFYMANGRQVDLFALHLHWSPKA